MQALKTVVRGAPLALLLAAAPLAGQQLSRVERLGHPPGTKLLIVHADDIGLAHSQNAASIAGLEAGLVSSGSVIVPGPWVPEFVAWYRQHPEADIGVHLTLTAEWQYLRWPGVRSAAAAPSLHDGDRFLPRTVADFARRASAAEAEQEMRAQVERARTLGLQPTHLDSHMFAAFATPEVFAAYLRVAREAGLPALIPADQLARNPALAALVGPDEVLVDRYVIAGQRTRPEEWAEFYSDVIRNLEPGTITEIIVHLAYDDAEMRAVAAGVDAYGAAWRQRDLDYFTSDVARKVLEENHVQLTTWRELGRLLPQR